jgi:aldehyde:ferredoxin oxidoreductase
VRADRWIATLDLSTGRAEYDAPDEDWWRRYAGGGAVGAWFLLHDVPRGADSLGPDNVLVIATSGVGGRGDPGLSRHAVLAKSP